MTLHRLAAIALSPLHVGDGSTWTPEAFVLRGDTLVRFDPAAVLASLDEAGNRRFLAAIDRNELHAAQRLLSESCRGPQERERIAVSESSRREIEEATRNPLRSGKVHPFARAAGRPCIPGSALKGALRTALLNEAVQSDLKRYKGWLEGRQIQRGKSGQASTDLQAQVLGKIDTDPFRFVRTADIELPRDSTRIEQILTWKGEGNRKGGRDDKISKMQMHFECLPPGSRFELSIDIRDAGGVIAAAARPGADRGKAPKHCFASAPFFRAVDRFYRGRMSAEEAAFFPTPWCPALPPADADGFPVLLRLGRFSHFESASIDNLRQGWQPQNGGKTIAAGATRAVVARGDSHAPFGWVLLMPSDRAAELDRFVQAMAPAPAPRPAPAATKGAGAGRATMTRGLVGRRGFVDGEPVEVLSHDGDELSVRFLDSGDIEPVSADDFETGN